MAREYERYQMRDGKTRLNQGYFNPIFQALDSRLDKIENLRVSWESAVSEVQQFGIERIDAILTPVVEETQQVLADAQETAAQLQQIIEETEGALGEDFAAQTAAVQAALDAQTASVDASLAALAAETETAIEEAVSAIEAVPVGTIILWVGTACPAGWARATELDGLFIKGAAAAGVPNLTPAGANTHSHTMNHNHGLGSHTHNMAHTHSGTSGTPNGSSAVVSAGAGYTVYPSHTHDTTTSSQSTSTTGAASGNTDTYSGSTASESNEPQHVTVLFCKKSA